MSPRCIKVCSRCTTPCNEGTVPPHTVLWGMGKKWFQFSFLLRRDLSYSPVHWCVFVFIKMFIIKSVNTLWLQRASATHELPLSVIPNCEEVPCALQYHTKLNPCDLVFSVQQATLKVQHQYYKANIPTNDPYDILKKVQHLHEEFNGLKKSKSLATG